MCDVDFDGDAWRAWSDVPRKARKPHACDSCGSAIRPGDAYLAHGHVNPDGGAESEKACFACWWTREAFAQSHRVYMSISFTEELLRECIIDDSEKGGWRDDLAGIIKRRRAAARTTRKDGKDE